MICERCQNEVKDDARFCAVCGKPTGVGNDLSGNDNVYSHIPAGEKLADSSAPADIGYSHITEQEPNKIAQTNSEQAPVSGEYPRTAPQQTNLNSFSQTSAAANQGYFLTVDQIAKLRADERARVMKYVEEQKKQEKPFFGAGALIACMVAIALLSVMCGVFAGLYFAVL